MKCVVHGSFRRNLDGIRQTIAVFQAAGIEVIAPKLTAVTNEVDGFVVFDGQAGTDPRLVELEYLSQVREMGAGGFSYFFNPDGLLGRSASYELGVAQATGVPCFFLEPLRDHPAAFPTNAIMSPDALASFVHEHDTLPLPLFAPDEQKIQRLWGDLVTPGSRIATGGIIELDDGKREQKILLVRTHKWGDRWSIVGGKVQRGERLHDALKREVEEETGLCSRIGRHLATFDQIKRSGYYLSGVHHVFVDYVVRVASSNVKLNDEAQDFIWMPAHTALRDLDIEPNARKTVEIYAA